MILQCNHIAARDAHLVKVASIHSTDDVHHELHHHIQIDMMRDLTPSMKMMARDERRVSLVAFNNHQVDDKSTISQMEDDHHPLTVGRVAHDPAAPSAQRSSWDRIGSASFQIDVHRTG